MLKGPVVCFSRGRAAVQRLSGRAAQFAQPGIVEAAVHEQIGAHPRADRKQRGVGDAIARPLREIGQRREGECCAPDRDDVEPDRDRMAGADDLLGDAELVRPTFKPLASTTRRAEIVSSLESAILCRSSLVSTVMALAQMRSTEAGISSRTALTRES